VWDASDEALIAGLATGDPDIARVFVQRFQSRVYGLALAITHDRAAAEEVAQDAYVRAWRYAASYDPRRGSVSTWLLRITRNVALDHVRARERRRDRVVDDPTDTLAELAGEMDVASPLGDLDVVTEGLRSLPDDQSATLMASAYYGLTAREISEAWDVPLGTVKTRLRLALAKLRARFAGVSP
jgi:RNA polymerase sigma factor (sigma-70 family)